MGRRNINTTKSGKYMNPTDQARKEARKRELKKNKKQRQMVRTAVLKGKDPTQIIMEMEKMDTMEYNVETQPLLSDKVLKDKRKKLKETLDRVLKLYEKENPEYWVEIRRMESDYEKKRQARMEYYDAVRHAQAVTVEEIPLPNLDMPPLPEEQLEPSPLQTIEMTQHIPIPTNFAPTHSILKKSLSSSEKLKPKVPPGCPPTVPPNFSDEEDDDDEDIVDDDISDHEELEKGLDGKSRKIRFVDGEESDEDKDTRLTVKKSKELNSLQVKLLQMSGQDIDQFMKDTEVLVKEKEAEKHDLKDKMVRQGDENLNNAAGIALPPLRHGISMPTLGVPIPGDVPLPPQLTSGPPGVAPVGVPPPPMMRPPMRPMQLPMGVRLPPGPPPHGLLPRLPNMRLPPPMGLRQPMRHAGMHMAMLHHMRPNLNPSNVLSAGPQLIQRPKDDDKSSSATIEAKPQIKSLSADVTRFLPTALRVKREDKKRGAKLVPESKEVSTKAEDIDKKPTKDDAYSQFMREMENLL